MARLPRVTGARAVRALKKAGWVEKDQVGSYVHLTHPTLPGKLTVPPHAGQTLGPNIVADLLKKSGLTIDEFRSLL